MSASREGDWIELDFPVNRPVEADPPEGLLKALGVEAECSGKFPKAYSIEAESDEIVRNISPYLTAIARLPEPKVFVTARDSTREADLVWPLFAPALGTNEDPVNGNSHTALTPYWASRLGRNDLLAHQVSERGGWLRLSLRGDRARISGQAVTVMRGGLTGTLPNRP